MSTWADFERAAPDLAAAARRLLLRSGPGEALLATVRDGNPPRIHPVNVEIVGGRLYVFAIARTPKSADLETDGRFALHNHVDQAVPSEFSIRGRARAVHDKEARSAAAAAWSFTIDETYRLFELSIETATLGERSSADEWPPRYASWRSAEQKG